VVILLQEQVGVSVPCHRAGGEPPDHPHGEGNL